MDRVLHDDKKGSGHEDEKQKAPCRNPNIAFHNAEIAYDCLDLFFYIGAQNVLNALEQFCADCLAFEIQAEHAYEDNDDRRKGERGKKCSGRRQYHRIAFPKEEKGPF